MPRSRRDHTEVAHGHASEASAVRLELLGPLQLTVDRRPVAVPGILRRGVLARLALARGEVVLVDTLLADLWPNDAPRAGRRALNSHLWRLRGHLGPFADRLTWSTVGYRLDLDEAELDLLTLDRRLPRARQLLATAPDEAAVALGALVEMWRGDALAEFVDLPVFAPEIAALAELRCELVDQLITAMLHAGEHDAVDAALRASSTQPLRERTHRLLMSALAADGRTADALRAGRDFRRRLAETTGLDPTATFADLEQRIAVGTPPAFPPLSKPAPGLVGRGRELADLVTLTGGPGLVTVTGTGGVGKTRLANELMATLPPGRPTAVVALAGLESADGVPALAAAAAGLYPDGTRPPVSVLTDLIHTDPWVLLLDNCEHLLQPVRDLVVTLLAACPNLTVVATSREPLNLSGETRMRLDPLDVPPAGGDLADIEASAAGRLFLERARHVAPAFHLHPGNRDAVAGIVRRLDGLPLAIELAAGRLTVFSVNDLHARLGRALVLLHGGRPTDAARHASLRATLDWSYRLLPRDAERLLCALSVFADGFTLRAAETIGAGIGLTTDPALALARLVDTSLVESSLEGETARYRMLETIRSFGSTVLDESGERTGAEAAQNGWATSLVAAIASSFGGPHEHDAVELIRHEFGNLRAVYDRAGAVQDVGAQRTLVVGLYWFANFCEIPDVLSWALPLAVELDADTEVFALASGTALMRGDFEQAEMWADRSMALTGPDAPHQFVLDTLATLALYRGQLDDALRLYGDAVASAAEPVWQSMYLACAGLAAGYLDDGDAALAYCREGAELAERCGSTLAQSLSGYVYAELIARRDPLAGLAAYEQSVALAGSIHAGFVQGIAGVGLATLQLATDQPRAALATYGALVEHWTRSGSWTQQWTTLRNLADALVAVGDHRTALVLITTAGEAPAASTLSLEAAQRLDELAYTCAGHLSEDDVLHIKTAARDANGPATVALALAAIDAVLRPPV